MREFALLQHVFKHNAAMPADVVIPPGDDMGAVRIGGACLLVTVDQVADGVHVRCATTPLELVARKAMVRNLSDVAAMAARPVGAVAAACLPRDWTHDQAACLADALHETGRRYHCPVIGGDVSIWEQPLLVTVTVFAEPAGPDGRAVLRSGARAGDLVYVTGSLGGAWDEQGGGPHLSAEPRIDTAIALADALGDRLRSMIDISDGLAADLGHICAASGVSAEIDADAVPCRPGATLDNALGDGEDYELCFTAGGDVPSSLGGVPVTAIGRIVSRDPAAGLTLVDAGGQRRSLTPTGWEHGHQP